MKDRFVNRRAKPGNIGRFPASLRARQDKAVTKVGIPLRVVHEQFDQAAFILRHQVRANFFVGDIPLGLPPAAFLFAPVKPSQAHRSAVFAKVTVSSDWAAALGTEFIVLGPNFDAIGIRSLHLSRNPALLLLQTNHAPIRKIVRASLERPSARMFQQHFLVQDICDHSG
jgi:hypothetical protein